MMQDLKVTNSNSTTGGLSSVRVYLKQDLIAEVRINHRKPLAYLQGLKKSKYFSQLEKQLFPHGISLSDCGIGVAA